MPDTGWVDFDNFSNQGSGTKSWQSADLSARKARTSDNQYVAIAGTMVPSDTTRLITANRKTGGFIPGSSTIDGIEVRIEISGGSNFSDNEVRLWNAALIGDDKAAGNTFTATDTYYVYGGPTDKWGVALTRTMVNQISFGFGFGLIMNGSGTPEPVVDHMQMKIYYSPEAFPAGGGSKPGFGGNVVGGRTRMIGF